MKPTTKSKLPYFAVFTAGMKAIEPTLLPLPAGFETIDAACGAEHTLLLGSDGAVVSCGADEHGQLGHAQPDDAGRCCELRPVALPAGVRGVVQASCGAHHAVALTDDARVVSWGSAEGGLLGRKRGERAGGGGGSTATLPAVVPLLTEHGPVSLSASKYHTVAVTAGVRSSCGAASPIKRTRRPRRCAASSWAGRASCARAPRSGTLSPWPSRPSTATGATGAQLARRSDGIL